MKAELKIQTKKNLVNVIYDSKNARFSSTSKSFILGEEGQT